MTKYLLNMLIIMNLLLSPSSVDYKKESTTINNKPEVIHTLTIHRLGTVTLENVLSFDRLYGFETTSEMSKRKDALAAVNGAFYDDFGHHLGGLIMNGEILTYPMKNLPMIIVDEKEQVSFKELTVKQTIKSKDKTIVLNGVNRGAYYKEWIKYTPEYGSTTRISRQSLNYIIIDDKITDIIFTDQPVQIPSAGYVLSYVTQEDQPVFKKNDALEYLTESKPEISFNEGIQSGGWLVKDGDIIAKSKDVFIGQSTAPAPRTLLGTTQDHKIIIKVIDGRQKNYSIGVSGIEAATIMKEAGCINAVYLDGGSSSTMVINHKLINKTSYSKGERAIAHALYLKLQPIQKVFWHLR